jgi:hypothetical protein
MPSNRSAPVTGLSRMTNPPAFKALTARRTSPRSTMTSVGMRAQATASWLGSEPPEALAGRSISRQPIRSDPALTHEQFA